ncbi:MAG: hypothetical protein JW768_06190 [Chitinispirillaceae bacterium]|nr:hypothetical protein [Chitinispirillaceae bacterium]
MDSISVPITTLVAVLLFVLVLFVIATGFRLPNSFFEKERLRARMRKRLMEREHEERETAAAESRQLLKKQGKRE